LDVAKIRLLMLLAVVTGCISDNRGTGDRDDQRLVG
jgi:hypothetical protein